MELHEARAEMRSVFLDGGPGQIVAGLVWLASALVGTLSGPKPAILVLLGAGMLIYPMTRLVLFGLRRPSAVSSSNPLRRLAAQVAFFVPLCLPVVLLVLRVDVNGLYPAMAVIVGAHYLPFEFLYARRAFVGLGAAMVLVGVIAGWQRPDDFLIAGWASGALMLVTGCWLVATRATERAVATDSPA